MARFMSTVESAAAISGAAPSGATANGLFGNLVASANSGYKIRRITLGIRAGASVPTSQQITVALVRTNARGSASATSAPHAMDPNTVQTSNITGLDTAWTAVPTPVTSWSTYLYEVSFNTQSGVDLPFEQVEEMICPFGAGNGIAFLNVGNALPTGHILTASIETDE